MVSSEYIDLESSDPLFADLSAVRAWDLDSFTPAPFNESECQSVAELSSYLSNEQELFNTSRILMIIRQFHSRGSLMMNRQASELLHNKFRLFNGFSRVLAAFSRDGSDTYHGRAAAHFGRRAGQGLPAAERFEMCLLLKFVEKNGREPGSSSDRDLLHEIKQWSVRQQGFYHSHEVDRREDKNVTILISPSADFWGAIKREFGAAHHRRSWGAVPMLAFESLTANWNDYVACLHRAVQNFKTDAHATDPARPNAGETNPKSLNTALEIMDRLQFACHALDNNIATIRAVWHEVNVSPTLSNSCGQYMEKEKLSECIEGVVRELEFQRRHLQSIMSRLESVTAMVRDLINLRNTYAMERMTSRSVLEAHTMRVIALLTLCFLPPTFIAGFLDMGYIDVASTNGHIKFDIHPGLWLYAAIALPLMICIIAGYLWWDKRNVRRMITGDEHV